METSWQRRPSRFSDIPEDVWSDWHWQQRNRLRVPRDFDGVLTLSERERDGWRASDKFRVAVTPHYAALMDPLDPQCPVRRQALPDPDELRTYPYELEDPLAEEANSPVPGLTHRYPDRALLYVTHNCPVYCRHCTRKRKVADPTSATSRDAIRAAIAHIRDTPAIRDVIVSGGDPLSLSDARLRDILRALRAIEHVEVIRLGTRNPVTLPQRITPEFAAMLREYRPIYVNTHFNHPLELGPSAELALALLLDGGCVLGNQMVLLKGVNDDPSVVMELNRKLLSMGCRPYYMLQCDMAEGINHFRTPLSVGLHIMESLRGSIGGIGIPDFVVDLPAGGGKVELAPNPEIERRGELVTFRSAAGVRTFVDVE